MPPPTDQDRTRSQPRVVYDVDDRPPCGRGSPSFFASGLISGGLTALVLNAVLPGRSQT